jgi:hypothetical protein
VGSNPIPATILERINMDNDLYKQYSVFRNNFSRYGKNSVSYLEDIKNYQKTIHNVETEKKNKSRKVT